MNDNRFHWQDGGYVLAPSPLNFTDFENESEDRVYEMTEISPGKGRK